MRLRECCRVQSKDIIEDETSRQKAEFTSDGSRELPCVLVENCRNDPHTLCVPRLCEPFYYGFILNSLHELSGMWIIRSTSNQNDSATIVFAAARRLTRFYRCRWRPSV